jgi:Family of unknown function (DUF5681)
MTRRKDPWSPDYAVGYRRPPKETRFAAGKSGNPRGRPNGNRPLGAILRDIIQQKIPVTENGKTRRISALEVMLRRLVNDAIRSDAKAMKLLLSLVDRHAESPETKLRLDELLVEDQAILAEFLLEQDGVAQRRDEDFRQRRTRRWRWRPR